MHDFLFVLIEL